MRVPVKNRKLAFPESLKFIRYLGLKYPTPGVTVTFASVLPGAIHIGELSVPVNGYCDRTAVHVAAIHPTAAKQLNTIAHEYRHAMQHNEGWFADAPAVFYQAGGGRQFRYCGAMEKDAEDFAALVVKEYLEFLEEYGEPLVVQDRDFATVSSDFL